MEVLTKILQQGTEFDTLAETVLADRFERLVELVTMMGDQGELPIAMALANVVPGSQWVCSSFGLGDHFTWRASCLLCCSLNFSCILYLYVCLCFQDELARVLVTLFDSRHLLYQLLWNMFSKEVELADSMQTLFRGNSLASKIMTFCFKVGIWSVSITDGQGILAVLTARLLPFIAGIWGSVPAEAPGAFIESGHHHSGPHQL